MKSSCQGMLAAAIKNACAKAGETASCASAMALAFDFASPRGIIFSMDNSDMSDLGNAGRKSPDNEITTSERSWGLIVHLSAFAIHILPSGGNIIGPLAVWLWKRETSEFVDDQGREAVNAQISYTLYGLLTLPFWFVIIGIPMTAALYIFVIVVTIMGAIAANNGERFRYPFIIRFLKK